jgi:hypothetical protein
MKDAKGHGSEPRGGGSSSPDVKANIQKAAQLAKTLGADHPSVGAALHDAVMAARPAGGFYKIGGGGQPVASNAHAAATLASGPKSVPVDVHPAQVGQMKMSSGDFASLRAAVTPHMASTADPSHSAMRQRWDAMNKSGYDTRPLYKAGLNDDHIDTALRKIQSK